MAQTYIVPITGGVWTSLSSGEASVLVQAKVAGLVVAVKATQPNTAGGHVLDEVDRAVSFNNLGATDLVWGWSTKDGVAVVTR